MEIYGKGDGKILRLSRTLALDVYLTELGDSVSTPTEPAYPHKNNDSDSVRQEHKMTFSSKPWSCTPTQTQKHD